MNTKAKLVSALDELLLELKDGTVKPDGTVDDEFGVYFAGQERGTGEKDSKEEVGLLIALERHYSGETDNQLNYFGSLLAQMKKEGKYKKFLTPPPGKIFRLLTLSEKTFLRMFSTIVPETWKENPNKIHVMKKTGTLHPPEKSQVQSWTYSANRDLASFISGQGYSNNVLLIVVADANQPNIFLNWQQMSVALPKKKTMIQSEKEAISIGPVNYLGLAYCYYESETSVAKDVTKDGQFFSKTSERMIPNWKSESLKLLNELTREAEELVLPEGNAAFYRKKYLHALSLIMEAVENVHYPLTGKHIYSVDLIKRAKVNNAISEFSLPAANFAHTSLNNFDRGKQIVKSIQTVIRNELEKIWSTEQLTREKFTKQTTKSHKILTGQKIASKEIK